MFKEAWFAGLTFTIGFCYNTQQFDSVVWNDIPHKIYLNCRRERRYPDLSYLDRFIAALEAKGIGFLD